MRVPWMVSTSPVVWTHPTWVKASHPSRRPRRAWLIQARKRLQQVLGHGKHRWGPSRCHRPRRRHLERIVSFPIGVLWILILDIIWFVSYFLFAFQYSSLIHPQVTRADQPAHNDDNKQKANTITELIGNLDNFRIMSYNNKAPPPPDGYANKLKVIYSSSKTASTKKTSRYIPTQPERILDAPDIKNDYYLKLIDWGSSNLLAVALSNEVFLWNAVNGEINNLVSLDESEYISSVSWEQDGALLAVGTNNGSVQIWDVNQPKKLRTLANSEMRISCSDWNSYILSCGSKDGNIYNHDVRSPQSLAGTMQGHTQEICGLKWSTTGRMLASGGNDNTLNVWSDGGLMGANRSSTSHITQPLFTFTDHQAAVKAVSWCPWRHNSLASGGGTADRMIRIWNCQTGMNMYSVDTKSQVSSILWSEEYKEIISSHGFKNNELIIWKTPKFEKVIELSGKFSFRLVMSLIILFITIQDTRRASWAHPCRQMDPQWSRWAPMKPCAFGSASRWIPKLRRTNPNCPPPRRCSQLSCTTFVNIVFCPQVNHVVTRKFLWSIICGPSFICNLFVFCIETE